MSARATSSASWSSDAAARALRARDGQDRRRAGRARRCLAERQSEFPAWSSSRSRSAHYPYGEMAAQVLGHVGQIIRSRAQLQRLPRRQAGHGRRPGRPRVLLRPLPARQAGVQRVEVDALGLPVPSTLAPTPPGRRATAQADARPRRCSRRAKRRSRRASNRRRPAANRPTRARSSALDPRNGQVLAMGSLAELRPQQVRQTADPGRIQRALGTARTPGAADQPRRQRRLSDRLDVQADHRAWRRLKRA